MVLQWITQSYCKTSFFLILQIRASVLHMVTWSTVPLSSRWSKRHSERESTHLILNIGQVEQFMSNITVLKQLCTLFLLKTLSMAAALIHLFSVLFFSSVCLTEAHLADMVTNTHTLKFVIRRESAEKYKLPKDTRQIDSTPLGFKSQFVRFSQYYKLKS